MLSHLESTKASKNELKTNWFFGPNEPELTPKTGQNSTFEHSATNCTDASLRPGPDGPGLRSE